MSRWAVAALAVAAVGWQVWRAVRRRRWAVRRTAEIEQLARTFRLPAYTGPRGRLTNGDGED